MTEQHLRPGSGSPTTPALIAWLDEEAACDFSNAEAARPHDPDLATFFAETGVKFRAAADALRSLPPPSESQQHLVALIARVNELDPAAADSQPYGAWDAAKWSVFNAAVRFVKEQPSDLMLTLRVLREQQKADFDRAERAEAEVARLQLERDRWFVECERLATGLIETFEERVDEDHDGDLKPEDAVDVAFRLFDDLVKSEAEVARLTPRPTEPANE